MEKGLAVQFSFVVYPIQLILKISYRKLGCCTNSRYSGNNGTAFENLKGKPLD